jgi:hypothetical protein
MDIERIQYTYHCFRRAQADNLGRGFKMPKNFEDHLGKMSEANKEKLIKASNYFLTKWSNIDQYRYFVCGFKLFKKSFSYMKFLDERILNYYITLDKNKKRETTNIKKDLVESAKYVKKWINDYGKTLYDYIQIEDKENGRKLAVTDYIKGKIDTSFFIWLITKGLILTDTDRGYLPYANEFGETYRNIIFEIKNMTSFMNALEDKINEKI